MNERIRWRLSRDRKTLLIRVDMRMLIQTVLGTDEEPTGAGLIMRGLTRREREIFPFIVNGKTHKETAAALNISERTVKFFASGIYKKTHVRGRTELWEMFNKVKVA